TGNYIWTNNLSKLLSASPFVFLMSLFVSQVFAANSNDSTGTTLTKSSHAEKGGLLANLHAVREDEAIHRGNFLTGATLFLLQGESDEDALNIIFGDIYKAEGYTFTAEGFGGYFIRDAIAIGARVGYSRTFVDIDFSILEDIADVKEHRKYVSNGFFVQPFLKNYLKVFDSRTVYFFNETSLEVEYSYGISQTDDGEEMSKTKNHGWTFNFGINPGLSIMVLDRLAFETSVGLLGLSSSFMEIEENGESRSEVLYNIVNFKINLLALDFSLVYFF
ncbi:hypothetical protein, partial [Fibrobacter sp. UWB1]|uniref:hypothetical protein n=1 Tax=Fibrobacter sp. UWB1 TaxID=1964355 RepID=UPI001BAFA488